MSHSAGYTGGSIEHPSAPPRPPFRLPNITCLSHKMFNPSLDLWRRCCSTVPRVGESLEIQDHAHSNDSTKFRQHGRRIRFVHNLVRLHNARSTNTAMSLVTCNNPTCENQVSTNALACPKCGWLTDIGSRKGAALNLEFPCHKCREPLNFRQYVSKSVKYSEKVIDGTTESHTYETHYFHGPCPKCGEPMPLYNLYWRLVVPMSFLLSLFGCFCLVPVVVILNSQVASPFEIFWVSMLFGTFSLACFSLAIWNSIRNRPLHQALK